MKKLLVFGCIVLLYAVGYTQTFNNEWIDYSKTYYKFNVGTNGLYRISQTALQSAGLQNVPVQNFQLWRNGAEVPLYTTIANGVLSANDYLEFYGQANDGEPDTKLYRVDSLQMNNKYSLYTDTAAYFLTINNSGNNSRIIAIGNDVAANTLPVQTSFNYTFQRFFKNRMNEGYGIDLGEIVHSASYENGEGWTSNNIATSGNLTESNGPLQIFSTGPTASFAVTLAGNSTITRLVTVKLNDATIGTISVAGYNIKKATFSNIALSSFTRDTAKISFTHNGTADNVVVANYEITYPRKYNFNNQNQFYFELPAGASRYIEISNFNTGGTAPVLYDIANNTRLVGDVASGIVKFVLPASAITMKLVLVSTASSIVKNITTFESKNFINYSLPINQGNYIIISHPALYNDGNGINQVEKYQQYRASAAGGNFNAVVVDVNQLVDQFAFGIKHHPSAIRNFYTFSTANFSTPPSYFFLIGKGLKYAEFRKNESDANISKQAMVPTFGIPASDNLLVTNRAGKFAQLPIGRLSAITGTEVGIYLEKIKQFELAQKNATQTIANKGWMKNIAHLTGGLTDVNLAAQINSYMQGYNTIAADSLFGGSTYSFVKNTGLNTAVGTNKTLDQLFSEGLSILNYFGHSSPNSIEFNLDNPEGYNNTGKYPLIIVNGCNSGDLFEFDTLRAISKGTLSEKFVLANQKGSIGYIASTHYGLPNQLNYVNTEFYKNICKTMYGQSLGKIMQVSMQTVSNTYPTDFIAQTHVEEITLHGDPAVKINPHTKPDFVVEDTLITLNPSAITAADYAVLLKAKVQNIGRTFNDSLTIRIQRKLADSSVVLIGNFKIKTVNYQDSINITIPLNPAVDKGLVQIIVTVDPSNAIDELSETNNSVIKLFTIIEDQIRPVYPYEYAIVNTPSIVLYASTVNPLAAAKNYVLELDTTQQFNSLFKVTQLVNSVGGTIKFTPTVVLSDSTVYYWRVASGNITANTKWLTSSFIYINNAADGYNQSHYYQYKNNIQNGIVIDSSTYKFTFENKQRKLQIRTGLFPFYDWDQINVNVDNTQLDQYGCRYRSLQIMVYDSLTLAPLQNVTVAGSGLYGSWPVCSGTTRSFFEFPYYDSSYRRKAVNFLNSIPNGMYVSITNLGWNFDTNYFIDKWKGDSLNAGRGNTLWHKFKQLGLGKIDSFTKNIPFCFLFKKGDTTDFLPRQIVGTESNSYINQTFVLNGKQSEGSITTPWMGPVYNWYKFKWKEAENMVASLQKRFEIIGRDINGNEALLATVYNAKDTSIGFIDAGLYPYLKMRMYNKDVVQGKPLQLKYWMLTADDVPEGAVSPNIVGYNIADTLTVADTLQLAVPFANITKYDFDSVKVIVSITDNNGRVTNYNNKPDGARYNPLSANDTLYIVYAIPLANFIGNNIVKVEVNPNNDQPELLHFNNYLFKQLFVGNAPICPGSNVSFNAQNSTVGNTYQWQLNAGNGYQDVVNSTTFVGATDSLIKILAPPTNMYGSTFRCKITNNTSTTYSMEYKLQFAVKWNSTVDAAWENSANWSCNILPDAFTDVTIQPGVTFYPIIGNGVQAICRKLTVRPGAAIQINSGANLSIKGATGNR